ncbi:unnamed protein product [Adineta ricciae]|uniref:Uncharacterized protein n=1 Tax=Adineta ricciae TaxID=249248 RepID=A0A815B972_ADIRI|nr:unnamed protein product [Adineta ricciae]
MAERIIPERFLHVDKKPDQSLTPITVLFKLLTIHKIIYRGVWRNLSDDYDIDKIWWRLSSCTEIMNVMEQFSISNI